MKINADQAAVLQCLSGVGDYYGEGPCYVSFAYITERTLIDRARVRRACRSLKRRGLTEFCQGLWNDEGQPAGAGYAITKAGLAWLETKRAEPTPKG